VGNADPTNRGYVAMGGIVPIPTTRVGDLFVRQRLVSQTQSDQLALFKLQSQISTGYRLQVPSEDAPAALRIINLQRLLNRKDQIQTNIQASGQYLAAADARLASVATGLSELRGSVLGVAGTVVSDSTRQGLLQDIDSLLQELVSAGNVKSQGRYLFAGSRSQDQPYDVNGQFVEYSGNDGLLRSYVDLERLFDTNLSGNDVFGGLSGGVQGSVDLDPHVSESSLVSTINGGNGIGRNPSISISINTGLATETSVVDLSSAVTIGDLARLIEDGAPAGTNIVADVTGTGLRLTTASGTISVGEVADGHTARELGILTPAGALPSSTLQGDPLNPAVLKTTPLGDLLGKKAQGRITSPGWDNDILLTATANGATLNDVRVIFQTGGTAGAEVVTYDDSNPLDKQLTIQIQNGVSTAAQVAAAITSEGRFLAAVDYHDATSSVAAGTGAVNVGDFGQLTSGGGGQTLDTSGLILNNGGVSATIDISGAETVEDLLNLINGAELGLLAEINADADGINVRSRWSGADFTIGENGGLTATQLGIRTYTSSTRLADFNRGVGVPTANDPADDDLVITARDGSQLSINLSTATTAQDVVTLINTNVANNTGTTRVVAQLATIGNGIELVDQSTVTTGSFVVQALEGSQAAEYLGFVPTGQTQVSTNTPDTSGNFVLQSADHHTFEVDSVFNTLLRLKTAVEQNDVTEIGRTLDRLDVDVNRVNFARAQIGSRLQNLQSIDTRLKDENVALRSSLSQDFDVDIVEAISNLTARQFAFQASLQSSASLLQLSLLNFI
jgi:flagellar hook-associated protein 3 FlgL